MEKDFFLKGDICWSADPESINTAKGAYLLCKDGKSGGVFTEIPASLSHLPVKDHSGKLIIPGLTDLHTHASQFAFRAQGMDLELLEWLENHTFPEESKYGDLEYARRAYGHFIEDVRKGPNTRLCVFATIHTPGTLLLMDMLEESGLVSLTGKVNMDRNCPDYLREGDGAAAAGEWLRAFSARSKEKYYKNTAPILTPRFVPSCSDGLMKKISLMQKEQKLPLQSHLSENRKEVEWVKELSPGCGTYAGAYAKAGLLEGPTIMAHCVWSDEAETELLAEKGVYIAHCPQSNMNLSSGIAPVRRFLEKRISIGLGSDIAGGAHTSIFRAMSDAIQVSKLRSALAHNDGPNERALSLEEAFYMGTAGGGSFFAKIANAEFGAAGSFEAGWDFDALVIDDGAIPGPVIPNLRDRLERVIYLSDDRHITGKYVRGKPLLP